MVAAGPKPKYEKKVPHPLGVYISFVEVHIIVERKNKHCVKNIFSTGSWLFKTEMISLVTSHARATVM